MAAALLGTGATAAELSATIEGSVWSKYLFRGVPYTDGSVAQPALTLLLGGEWTVTTWMNIDLANANRAAGRPTETDVTLRWAPAVSGVLRPFLGLATSVISQPSEATGTSAELAAGLRGQPLEGSAARWLPALEVSLWHEVLEYDDSFVELAAERVIPLGGWADRTLRITAGWAGGHYHSYFFGTDHAGWSDGSCTAELGRSVGDRWRVSLMTQYQTLLSPAIRSASRERHGESDW